MEISLFPLPWSVSLLENAIEHFLLFLEISCRERHIPTFVDVVLFPSCKSKFENVCIALV